MAKVDYIFVVATYGSTYGNGGCISQAKKLLAQKDKNLNAAFYAKTVDNFILWTWDIPADAKHPAIHKRAEERAVEIAQKVSRKENYWDYSFMEYIGPLVFRNKHFIKIVNTTDQAFYHTLACTSCGLCARVCLTRNIQLNGGKPNWKSESCQRCLACLHLCPCGAIQYGKVTLKRRRYKNPYVTVGELTRKE